MLDKRVFERVYRKNNVAGETRTSRRFESLQATRSRRFKEDYIPNDRRSFSEKYGNRQLVSEDDDNLVPDFIKDMFK